MITQIKQGKKFINVSIAITDGDGKSIDPSIAEAYFYKVSQVDGSISLDTNVNSDGKVTLLKQDNQVGFYGSLLSTESLLEAEYVILYKVTVNGIESITVEYLSIDKSKKEIENIKIETDKIQPEIIDKKDEYRADSIDLSSVKINTDKIPSIKNETDKIQTIDDNADSIKAKTDNLPQDPATESNLNAVKTLVIRTLGLSKENYKLFDITYSNKLLTTAKIKLYASKSDLETNTSPIAEYGISADYNGDGTCKDFKVKKVA